MHHRAFTGCGKVSGEMARVGLLISQIAPGDDEHVNSGGEPYGANSCHYPQLLV